MKTTIDLPPGLARKLKIRGITQSQKINVMALKALTASLHIVSQKFPVGRRVKLPLIQCRHSAISAEELTPERVSEILLEQEMESINNAA